MFNFGIWNNSYLSQKFGIKRVDLGQTCVQTPCEDSKAEVRSVTPLLKRIGSLSNHDDDGNKNRTNLHIDNWMKNSIFARFARAYFIFWHFEDVLVLSMTWNDLFCSCVDDVSIWWQMFNFVWFHFNSRIVRTHFSSKMTLNIKNDCRNAKLHFQMTFSLPSTSCLLKLPN